MALGAPVLDHTYRYPFPSSVVVDGDGDRRRLRLATSGGPSPNPRFFEGRLLQPVVASDLLLSLSAVARSRFHTPPGMLARILELADPVVTCGDDRLRFEAFSACGSVYGRVDLVPEAWDGEAMGRGTTNVDFGPGVRAALASVQEGGRLELALGADDVAIRTDAVSAVERRVSLPARWLRGFLEVQAIQPELQPSVALDARGARSFLRSIPASPPKGEVWIVASGGGLRLAYHDPGKGAIAIAGLARLRLLGRLARHATGLHAFAVRGDGSTGWQLDVPGGRLTLVVSPDVWRGFSGEGRTLHALAGSASPGAVAGVRAAMGWAPRLDPAALIAVTGRAPDEVAGALAALALSGIVGYDLAERGFFRRELPFDLDRIERFQPRLRDAKRLVERGAVAIDPSGPSGASDAAGLSAWVRGSGDVEYRVRLRDGTWTCTCPWYGAHRGDRGPCKHVLSVQLVAIDDPG